MSRKRTILLIDLIIYSMILSFGLVVGYEAGYLVAESKLYTAEQVSAIVEQQRHAPGRPVMPIEPELPRSP